MSRPVDLNPLEAILEHRFRSRDLLTLALTHRSLGHERSSAEGASQRRDNERLEFLGDAVLGLLVSQALYSLNPDWQEGELTRVKAELVSRKHMAQVALSIDLGRYLLLGKGEERSGGRRKLTLLANAMEAVLAALYLDGGLEVVRRVADRFILGELARQLAMRIQVDSTLGDGKSALQEQLQAARLGTPTYAIEQESGPDHRKQYQVALRLRRPDGTLSDILTHGLGGTRKKAEQEAARIALQQIAAFGLESLWPLGEAPQEDSPSAAAPAATNPAAQSQPAAQTAPAAQTGPASTDSAATGSAATARAHPPESPKSGSPKPAASRPRPSRSGAPNA